MAPSVSIASTAAWPLFIIGLLIGPRMAFSGLLMDLGIAFFAGAVLFHIVTLPVEFDASKRALVQLTSTGAAMAALQLLRLIVLRNDRR